MNSILTEIDTLKHTLRSLRPLSKAELQRLRDEFIIETTYNSNAYRRQRLLRRCPGDAIRRDGPPKHRRLRCRKIQFFLSLCECVMIKYP